MSDLATIGLQYNPAGGKAAQAGLQAIIPPAVEAQKAVDKTGSSFDRLDAAADKFAAAAAGLSTATTALTAALDKQASAASSASVANDKNATSLDRAAVGATTLGAQVTALNVSYGQSFTAAVGLNKQLNTQSTAAAAAGSSMQQLDAHVLAFRNILELTTVATEGSSKSIVQLDAHIEAYKTHLAGLNGAANSAKTGIDKVTKAANDNSGAMRANTGNIAAQFQDIGVTAAMGMNPLLIALQQGTQLSAVFAQSGGKMGAVLGAAFKQVFSSAALLTIGIVALAAAAIQMVDWVSLAKSALNGLADILVDIAPYAVGAAAALTLIYAPSIVGGIVALTQTLYGLAAGLLATVGIPVLIVAGLTAIVAAAVHFRDELTQYFGVDIVGAAQSGVNYIIGAFVGGYDGIVAVWDKLPAALGDVTIQAVNATLSAIDGLVNGAISRINALTAQLPFGVGDNIQMGSVKFGQQANPYAGMAKAAGDVVKESVKAAQSIDYVGKGIKAVKGLAESGAKALRGFANSLGETGKKKKDKAAGGGKTDAENLEDIVKGGQREIEMLKAQQAALGLSADEALKLTNRQKFLNDAMAKGIPITDKVRSALNGVADALTDAQIAFKNAKGFDELSKAADKQFVALTQAGRQIGLYGQELYSLVAFQGMYNDAVDKGLKLGDAEKKILADKARLIGKTTAANDNAKFMAGLVSSADQATEALKRQRGEIGLNGAELIAYQHETDILADAQRQHITLTDKQKDAIHESSKAFGEGTQAIENMRTRLAALNDLAGKGPLGDLFKVLMSDDPVTALLGMGGIGTLLGLSTKGGQEQFKQQGEIIAKKIKETFPELGDKLAGALSGALQGAGIGSQLGTTLAGKTGGKIGSAVGAVAGSIPGGAAFLSEAAGPLALASEVNKMIGNIFGFEGGPLGIFTGLFKSVKKATATFDEMGLIATNGNSSSRKASASAAGNSALDRFNDILDQLGATASGIKFSTGMRGKNFTLDPTGGGRTKGSGVLNFGKDEEAFLAATLQEIFNDASFSGISEGVARLVKSGKVEDALTLNAAYSDLSQRKDPQAFDLSALDKEFTNLRSIATAAGEGLAQVEELYGLKRAEIVAKYAEDASQKEQAALDLAADKRQLEIQIMDLSGDKLGALAAAREIERAGVDETLRPLYDRIYALQDEATAAAETARIADQRAGLEQRLLELSGNTVAIRAAELATLDPSNRSLQQRIYNLEDEATAVSAAAEATARATALASTNRDLEIRELEASGDATGALAARRELEIQAADVSSARILQRIYNLEDEATATQTASDALAKATALASTNRDLEIREMELLGNTTGALAARRQIELTAADASTAVILRRIYALEDEATAADAAAKAADDLAAKTKAITDERLGLENQWLQLVGNTAEIRKRELAELDPSNRQLQQNIWDYQDALDAAAAAQEAATQAEEARNAAIADARDVLSEAYNRERDELQSTIDTLKDFSDGVKEFRLGLYADAGTPGSGYGEARNKFLATSTAARGGDATAMGNFTSDAQAFLELARGQAASLEAYQLDVAMVAREALAAESGATGKINVAERQQAALDAAVQGIFGVNEKLVSFKVALDRYNEASAATVPVITQSFADSSAAVAAAIQAQGVKTDATAAETTEVMMTMLVAMNTIARFTQRIDGGDAARVMAAETLPVTVLGTVATDEVP